MSLPSKLPALAPDRLKALAASSTNAASVFSAAGEGDVSAALAVAESIADLRVQFDDPGIRARIVALQDTAIGFRTDRDPKVINKRTEKPNVPYDYETVKDCCIEAMLRGLQLVGNQFNIIAGRQYTSKEGLEYLIRRRKDVTLFQISLGVPKMTGSGAIVTGEASWTQTGTPRTVKAELPVKADQYSGADQVLGKATRKLLARCYAAMSGSSVPEGDAEDAEPAPALPPAGGGEAAAAATTEALKNTAPPSPRPRATPKPATAAPVPSTPATPAAPPAETVVPAPQPEAPPADPAPAPAPSPAPVDPGPGPLPEEQVEQLLTNANVADADFFGWLVSTGRIKDASLLEHVGDVPPAVLAEILRPDGKGIVPLSKCLRLYGSN